MRLHQLRLQAFGPFAGTERIDFDALSAGGLHLIHGPTGAGKTSILDAICFALFAGVPGGRMQGRDTLHSDHAAATDRPEVELEFGVGDQRLRIRRSPEHQVAKKRGSGTRTQRGSVVLEERRDGTWVTISTRADEVAQTVGELLGMGLAQFAQVMLLPQGEFTAFLCAKPEDRGRLLERLFDISDFAAVEQWLLQHRKSLETQCVQAETRRATLIARAQETVGELAASPDSGDGESPHELDEDAESVAAFGRVVDDLSRRLTQALAAADDAAGRVEQLRSRLSDERALAALQQHARDAQRTLQEVCDRADEVVDAEQRLAAAARAERCAPAIAAVERRRHTLERAQRSADERRAWLARSSGWAVPEPHSADGLSEAALAPLLERAAAGTDALAGQPEMLRQAAGLDASLGQATGDLAAARTDVEHRRGVVDAAVVQLKQLQARRDDLRPVADARAAWQQLLEDVDHAAGALDTATRDATAAVNAEREHRRTRQEWMTAESEVLRLRNARLAGIAAELATDLDNGTACPVCGSIDHPHPAQPAEDHVDADQVAAAEDALATATARETEVQSRWSAGVGRAQATCRTALDLLTRFAARDTDGLSTYPAAASALRAGLAADLAEQQPAAADPGAAATIDPELCTVLRALTDTVTGAREAVAAHLTGATSAQRQLAVVDEQLRAFEAERVAAEQAAAAAAESVRLGEAHLASLESQLESTRSRITEMDRAHNTACGCGSDPDTDAGRAHAACVTQLEHLSTAATAHRTAAAELSAARAELERELEAAGFADARSAEGARLSDRAQHELRNLVDRARSSEAKATGVLEQKHVAAALAAPPAEADEVARQLSDAERVARRAHDAVGELRRAHGRLLQLTRELTAHDNHHAPLREQLAVVSSLAAAVAGSGDNTMRMRLTAYVLAARLESVTALANERLQLMTDGRYQLEHTDERAARGSKSGLGLRVRDAWTGTTRDTATLSGGESFIASLALALGLGDAVLEAAGGRRLETLLVDEGFGSLDEDSLEQVLDVLDALRAGGRNVGIVSHVAELRTRIPAQIRVRKTARGSTLQVVTDAVA